MKWFLFKMLFSKQSFIKILRKHKKETIIDYKQRALDEENYELAAYIQYYLEFKFKEEIYEKLD